MVSNVQAGRFCSIRTLRGEDGGERQHVNRRRCVERCWLSPGGGERKVSQCNLFKRVLRRAWRCSWVRSSALLTLRPARKSPLPPLFCDFCSLIWRNGNSRAGMVSWNSFNVKKGRSYWVQNVLSQSWDIYCTSIIADGAAESVPHPPVPNCQCHWLPANPRARPLLRGQGLLSSKS